LNVNDLAAALAEIEHAAHHFLEVPSSPSTNVPLLDVLHRRQATLNEPYGFDPNTDALRLRVWKDCMAVISNLELTPEGQAAESSELLRTQIQKLSTLTGGLIDLVGQLAQKS
jgi:hypothetical protein